MNLFFNQVMEFQHVHNAHSYFVFERLTRSSVKQDGLTTVRKTCASRNFLISFHELRQKQESPYEPPPFSATIFSAIFIGTVDNCMFFESPNVLSNLF